MRSNFRISGLIVTLMVLFLCAQMLRAQKSDFDTAKYPHDFTDTYYLQNGVNPVGIISRFIEPGGLSVLSYSSDPNHTNMRILITLPAYDQNGEVTYWYPLGELRDYSFTEDQAGCDAQSLTDFFPIYIFPNAEPTCFNTPFLNARQAPIIDNSWMIDRGQANPLGIRRILVINYTDNILKAENLSMLRRLGAKNGVAADGTPIVKSLDDILLLMKYDLITVIPIENYKDQPYSGAYVMGPIIPGESVIANDAFLWTTLKDDQPLAGEIEFVRQFHCLQQTGKKCQ